MTKVCFTGHRKMSMTPEIKARLYDTLEKLIQDGITDFYAGGAYGWDMLCELTVLKLRKIYPQIRLHLILPCPSDEQTKFWRDYYKRFYYRINELADSVKICSPHYYGGCMEKRNKRLVQLGNICVCYYDGRESGGTAQTVDMAKDKGINVMNLYRK